MYQEGIYGMIRRNFGDVLIGDSVETSIIDSFSASVINMLITEAEKLSIIDVSTESPINTSPKLRLIIPYIPS